jgi:hypothetical protein
MTAFYAENAAASGKNRVPAYLKMNAVKAVRGFLAFAVIRNGLMYHSFILSQNLTFDSYASDRVSS